MSRKRRRLLREYAVAKQTMFDEHGEVCAAAVLVPEVTWLGMTLQRHRLFESNDQLERAA